MFSLHQFPVLPSSECYNLLQDNIKTKQNLDKTAIRQEFKIEIYQIYILPSIRFLLTVHDLPVTYLTKLDTMADQHLKNWAGLPRCATTAILQLDTAKDSFLSTTPPPLRLFEQISFRLLWLYFVKFPRRLVNISILYNV